MTEEKGELNKEKRLLLTPRSSTPPQLYGLPKVHKEGTPLRPIVFAIGSPTHKLAKELARILFRLAGHTSSFVKNSAHFVEQIRSTTHEDNDKMVSFDVTSLFTKVPVEDAMAAIRHNDKTLDERTLMTTEETCKMTKLCLASTYFQFKDTFYEQVEGAAMGSPLSPIVANLYMEAF